MSQTHNIKNLWGDLPLEKTIRTPYIILKEQASILTEATNGLLIGSVIKENWNSDAGSSASLLKVTVPSMDNYSVSIVRIEYLITIYPSRICNLVKNSTSKEVYTEEDLTDQLGEILSSGEVRKIVSSFLSDIRAENSVNI